MHDNLNTITLSFREELEYVTAKGNNVTKIVWTKISNLTAINMACHKFFFFFFITIKSLPLIFHQCLKSILGPKKSIFSVTGVKNILTMG